MKNYQTNIKECYILPILNNIKKHEFRLFNEKRQAITIGDLLILNSNEVKEHYIEVLVIGIEIFSSWDEVINKYYSSEFSCLYEDKETALLECKTYYSDEDVKKYGIVSFAIKPIGN